MGEILCPIALVILWCSLVEATRCVPTRSPWQQLPWGPPGREWRAPISANTSGALRANISQYQWRASRQNQSRFDTIYITLTAGIFIRFLRHYQLTLSAGRL